MKSIISVLSALLFLAGTVANSVQAGAWTREEGKVFIAFGGNFLLSDGARLPVHYDPTLYAEYGWDGHVTLGAEFYTADTGRIVAGLVFASVPIGPTDKKNKFAFQIALGTKLKQGQDSEALLRAGLSWGRPLESGWLAVDTYATIGSQDHVFRGKIDATWGHHWSDRWSTSLQLQAGQGSFNDIYAKVAPSIMYRIRPNIVVSLGAVQALTGDKGAALKLETWLTF